MNLYDIVSPMTMAEAKTDYEKRRQRERDVDAGKPVAKQRQPKMTDYQKKRAQDKKDMELGEAMGYESDKRYMLAGKHNIYDIYVGKKKFNDVTGFIAVAVHPRTKDATRFNAPTQQGAIEKAKAEINKIVDTAPKISGAATIDFNVDFKRDILEMSDLPFYAKIIPGPKLVIAGKEMEQYPDIMKAEGFKKSSPRSEKGNKLPGVDLSSSSAKAIQIVANGRYVLGNETIDKDGNRVFDLDLDSTVAGKGDMAFLKTPGFTIGTPRAKNEDAWHAGDNAWSSDNHEMVEGQLNVGDPVVVTASNEFEGKTGEIAEFSPSGKFVVVDLYNHGQHSMHLSDVAYNDYADVQDDVEGWEDDYHDEYYADLKEVGVDEGFQDFNKVEPYAVCLAGKPVKKFDYYEQARRFHDNWKQKLYREGNKAKADTITLMPLNLDEAMNVNDLLNKVTKDSNKNFKKAKAGKLKASGDFTKGDHWTGPDKDDPSYTKNFGHGYPDTPSNRSHDRYVKKSLKKGVAEETREAELNRKFNSPEQLKKDADYRAYRAGVKASRKQPPTPLPVKEDWIDDNAAEPLARYFADLYYGDFSATEKVKLTAYIYQSIQDGKLSIDQLKADIDMLEKEKGIKEQGVAEMDSRGHTGTRDDYEKDRKHKGPVGTGTPVPVKDFVKGVLKDLKKVNVKEQGVAEAQLDEATSREILLGLLDKFYADMKLPPRQGSHSGALDIKSPGTKVWTRGDGTRLRDPGYVKANRWADDKKQAEKAATNFWPWLLKQPGVKSIGQVSGQFGSSPMTDAVSYKGLYFSGGPYGTEFGSMSRVKNPKSVWRHKPFELEPKAEQGVAEGIVDTIRSKNYARLADRSADKRATALDNFDEPEHQKQTDIMKQRNLKSRLLNKKGVAEADETSWTANSAQFRKEEDMSWPVEITLEPNADINQGRGRQVKTMTVTGQSRDAAKKKLVDYFLKNGWTVTGIKFTGDLDEQGVVEGTGQWIVKYWDKRPENTPAEDKFGSEEQARAFLAKLPAHYVKALRQERSVAEVSDQTLQNYKDKAIPAFYDAVAKDNAKTANKRGQGISKASHKQARRAGGSYAFHEDVSRLSDAEYNRVAAYVRKKYPGTQLSGLGRNPDGSFNVMIDTGSGRHEFKVRFREPEETDIKENDPCWKDYKQVGMKTKGGKQVPNCVPKESVQESYWTKLQNERNTKLNSLVNELKESIKK